ncbi:hypothetical protein Taro_035624 [Colocasia esculenta]|uniref:Uncharacterized protein n=1 Tax=Colocasia esculenta TaxID=4460 RepID=A0A843VZF0_COLES|nr:hypothetical protein [Colocasia esculenta]
MGNSVHDELYTTVRGTSFQITPNLLSRALQILNSGADVLVNHPSASEYYTLITLQPYDSTKDHIKLNANSFPLLHCLIHHIFTTLIAPKDGSRELVTEVHKSLFFFFLKGQQINLPVLMLDLLKQCFRNPKRSMPYACPINSLLSFISINIPEGELVTLKSRNAYDLTVAHRMGYKLVAGRVTRTLNGQEPDEDEEYDDDAGNQDAGKQAASQTHIQQQLVTLHRSFMIFVIPLLLGMTMHKLLKKEISKARIQILEPILRGPAGVEYLQKAFANRYGPPSDAVTALTMTAQWISSSKEKLQEWEEHTDSFSLATSQDLLPATALRSGDVQSECKGERVDVLVRLGLLRLVSNIEGLIPDALPETLELNFLRLRNAQSQFQKIIVICTSLLVLRQTLLSEDPASSTADVDSAASHCAKGLIQLLNHEPDVGIKEIIEALARSLPPEDKRQERKEVMARVLSKSLQAGDTVFMKVSRAVYLAVRGVVLGGSDAGGRKMAESALQRVGGALLLEQVLAMAEVVILMAVVSGQVHRAWYECLV